MTPDGSTQLVYWQGTNNHLYEAWYTGTWNGPIDVVAGSASLASAPSVAVSGSTQLVFWRGTNRHLYEAWYTGSWNGPADLSAASLGGALLGTSPGVSVAPDGTQLVFWGDSGGR